MPGCPFQHQRERPPGQAASQDFERFDADNRLEFPVPGVKVSGLANGKTLVLEIKGEDTEQNRAKRSALDAWVKGVNAKGGFGVWCWDVAFTESQIHDILGKHARP